MNIPRRLAAILVAAWSAVATVILGAAVYLLLTGQVHAQTTRADIEREIGGAFERSEWTAHERRAFTLSLIAHEWLQRDEDLAGRAVDAGAPAAVIKALITASGAAARAAIAMAHTTPAAAGNTPEHAS